MRVALWHLGFGLSPLWTSVALVLMGRGSNADYWAVAPWLIVIAIPLSGVTLLMACVTHAVYARTRGTRQQKFRRAAWVFGLQLALVLTVVCWRVWKYDVKKRNEADAKEAGRILVERSEPMAHLVPGKYRASLSVTRYNRDKPMVLYYNITEKETLKIWGTAAVVVSDEEPRLRLACVLPPGTDYMSFQKPCQ